ncbi:conserved Plasmodium protein, unknown function [Plasmodium berghei]|uniref:Uncharacterized protein n=2 Tax=Plasmodium berghei TaxID=5821 RepID=A0A509APP3_PLABA|nr:conserved Plasmodium protein, unknown function [Plasmodium berghei ANKA]CXJ03899.1 conserved Plasmodium protein, unknown function [Plasmodium berghei]SCL98569.1 conserved Plasmodium protein, unknown function [Plasmodium berghei]SCM16855.1 conserved Plasmodium protein, unknown function [Plasmodium berghei]SCM18653.1 conserved Plasmodium protein, unknown function [Plasmodium berghei]SCN28088.1 conserved Plasmodium protein, unknown function [Plasmodium berghei]|eukprot:XP_034423738.1 conserved Plasmodium protein, unknown function [Plasmodium berghei ANKA]
MNQKVSLPYETCEMKRGNFQIPKEYHPNVKYGFFRNLLFGKYTPYYFKSFFAVSGKILGGFLLFYYPLDKIHCNIRRFKRNLQKNN